jgi:hypothetical protein
LSVVQVTVAVVWAGLAETLDITGGGVLAGVVTVAELDAGLAFPAAS